jgi:UDP-glucose-4-epimerase GalE
MNILLTGGAGYVGSHAARLLQQSGHVAWCYDNLAYGHRAAAPAGRLIEGDLMDRAKLDAVFREKRIDAVMLFAAFAYVGVSVTDPAKYYQNNIVGTLSLLDAMRDAGVNRIVFSSTCATYGVPKSFPITEDTPQNPVNPYGASKLMVERILADAGAAHGLGSAVLRYFNAAGSDPDGEIGEAHEPETHLIPLMLEAARGRGRLQVFGNDYDTPDGSCIRDYIHVSDLADAHVLALSRLLDGGSSRVYNLGNGQGFSVFDVINAAARVTGRAIPHDIVPRRAGDPPALVADARRAREELGWRPRFADIDTQIDHAWRYMRRRNA